MLDTSVLIAALRSRRGASARLLSHVGTPGLEIALSTALVLEYEAVALRELDALLYSAEEIEQLLDFLCANALQPEIYYLWRPVLPDPNDDFILELSVAAGCRYIVTHNVRHFRAADAFSVEAFTPGELLTRYRSLR